MQHVKVQGSCMLLLLQLFAECMLSSQPLLQLLSACLVTLVFACTPSCVNATRIRACSGMMCAWVCGSLGWVGYAPGTGGGGAPWSAAGADSVQVRLSCGQSTMGKAVRVCVSLRARAVCAVLCRAREEVLQEERERLQADWQACLLSRPFPPPSPPLTTPPRQALQRKLKLHEADRLRVVSSSVWLPNSH